MKIPDFAAIAAAIGGTFEPSEHAGASSGIIRINPFWFCNVRHSNPKGWGTPSHVVATSPRQTKGADSWRANISDGRPPLAIGKEIMRRVLEPSREAMRAWHEESRADEIREQGFRQLLQRLADAVGAPIQNESWRNRPVCGPVTFDRLPGENRWHDKEFRFTVSVENEAAAMMIMRIVGQDWQFSRKTSDSETR